MLKVYLFVFLIYAHFLYAQTEIGCSTNGNLATPVMNESDVSLLVDLNNKQTKECIDYIRKQAPIKILSEIENKILNQLAIENVGKNKDLATLRESTKKNSLCSTLTKQISSRIPKIKLFENSPGYIEVKYPYSGMNRGIEGKNYDRGSIKEIVQLAISAGVDPNLVLAIKFMEMPPVKSDAYLSYRRAYGVINMDSIAFYNSLGCIENRDAAWAPFSKSAKIRIESLDNEFRSLEACISKFKLGTHPIEIYSLLSEYKYSKGYPTYENLCSSQAVSEKYEKSRQLLCRNPKKTEILKAFDKKDAVDKEKDAFINKELESAADSDKSRYQSVLRCGSFCHGLVKNSSQPLLLELSKSESITTEVCADTQFILAGDKPRLDLPERSKRVCCSKIIHPKEMAKDEVITQLKGAIGIRVVKGIQDKITPGKNNNFSLVLQSFNGIGCLGCTEGTNLCLDGIHTSDRPIYGARTADILVNSIINNPEIQSVIKEVSLTADKPIKNIFCIQNGPGKQKIDSKKYYLEQKEYLLNESENPYKYEIKKGTFKTPDNEDEKIEFSKREKTRRSYCEPYFKKKDNGAQPIQTQRNSSK